MRGGLGDYAKYGSIGISWVLSTAVYLYIGYRGGQWADARLGTAPIFFVLGMVMAIGMSLLSLTKELMVLDRAFRRRAEPVGGDGIEEGRERKHFPESRPPRRRGRNAAVGNEDRGTKPR